MKHQKILPKEAKKPLEPLITFRAIKEHMRVACHFTMGNYLGDVNWKWHWRPTVMVGLMIIVSICFAVDAYNHRNDWTHLVFSGCLVPPYLVMSVERIWLVNHVKKPFFAMYINMEKYIEKWEKDAECLPILMWYCRALKYIVYGCTGSFVIGGFLFITVTVVLYYVVTGKMILLIALYIPGIDYQSHPGFEINIIYQTYMCFLATTGYSIFINSMIVVLALSCAEADIIIQKEETLHKMLEKNKKDVKITNSLKEIYELHQEMLKLIDNIEDMWSIQQLSDHIIFGGQIILILYIVLQQFWLPGYFMVAAALFIIFTIDLLGTIVEVKLDKLLIKTYDVPWYLLSIQNQKNYNYFLQNTQKTARLTLRSGPPLNLDTFVRFCKGIYSYLVVLRETA